MSLICLGRFMPYITASIVVQFGAALSPTLAAVKKGRRVWPQELNQYNPLWHRWPAAVQGLFHSPSDWKASRPKSGLQSGRRTRLYVSALAR